MDHNITKCSAGQTLGRTSRKVEIDRKTWDLFKQRSLGRAESCEFSLIEQIEDLPETMTSFKSNIRRTNASKTPPFIKRAMCHASDRSVAVGTVRFLDFL